MKSLILRLGLILTFLGCVVILVAVLSFEDSVLLLLFLVLAGVWGVLLKPNVFTTTVINSNNARPSEKDIMDMLRVMTPDDPKKRIVGGVTVHDLPGGKSKTAWYDATGKLIDPPPDKGLIDAFKPDKS